MSIHFSQGKLQGRERTGVIQEVQKQAKAAAIAAIKPVITGFLEAEQSIKLGREKGEPRRVSGQPREIDWPCGQCGCRDANQFTRDGHYRRSLATGWGLVEGLQVPMLECQCCGHDVIGSFAILEKYQRFWLDLDQRVLFSSGLCQSLRQVSQEWSALLDSSVGLRTINDRINQIEPVLRQAGSEAITDVPAVVQFDGIWLRVQSQTDTLKPDKRGRKRHQRAWQESGVARRARTLDGWQWQAGDPGLASGRWGKPSSLGPVCASSLGTGRASGKGAASGDQRWVRRVRRGGGVGVWDNGR